MSAVVVLDTLHEVRAVPSSTWKRGSQPPMQHHAPAERRCHLTYRESAKSFAKYTSNSSTISSPGTPEGGTSYSSAGKDMSSTLRKVAPPVQRSQWSQSMGSIRRHVQQARAARVGWLKRRGARWVQPAASSGNVGAARSCKFALDPASVRLGGWHSSACCAGVE